MQYQDVVVPAQVFPVEAKEDTHPYICLPILTLSPATRQRSAQQGVVFNSSRIHQDEEISVDSEIALFAAKLQLKWSSMGKFAGGIASLPGKPNWLK